jgi:YHS domain-containing protein
MTTIIPTRPDSTNQTSQELSEVDQSTRSTKIDASSGQGMYPPAPNEDPITDPVCGMAVTVRSPLVVQYQDKAFYFCNAICKNKFIDDPSRYLEVHGDGPEP